MRLGRSGMHSPDCMQGVQTYWTGCLSLGQHTHSLTGKRTHANMNKIILADNQAIFRAGTAKILAMEDDFRIIAQCPDSDRLYQALDAFRGVVLMFASTLKTALKTL